MPNTKEKAMLDESTEYLFFPISKVISFLQMFMPETLAKRIICIVLLAVGISPKEVARISGFCIKTVTKIKNKMDKNETEGLFILKGGGRKSILAEVETEIVNEVLQNQYHSKQQIADMIQEKYGIKVTPQCVGKLLKKNDIRRLKCGSIPAKADTEAQRNFYNETLHPLMEQAKAKSITLLFVDASHFVMGCDFLGCIYGKVRQFVRTCSGRKRYNVLGAIDFATKNLTTITNDSYITAVQVCELLRKLAIEYAGIPVYIILDNASYQRCNIVKELASDLGLTLVFIPSYSPNLNLIERYWKFVKSKLRVKYYTDFNDFMDKINTIIALSGNTYKADLDKLISERVQLFDGLEIKNSNPCVFTQTHMTSTISLEA